MAWIALFAWLVGLLLSIAFHEAAHVYAGVRCGWTFTGLMFKPKLFAVGVKLEPNGDTSQLWKIAAAGPLATNYLAWVFYLLADMMTGPFAAICSSLFWFNIALLAINLLPFPGLDGGHIYKGLRSREAEEA